MRKVLVIYVCAILGVKLVAQERIDMNLLNGAPSNSNNTKNTQNSDFNIYYNVKTPSKNTPQTQTQNSTKNTPQSTPQKSPAQNPTQNSIQNSRLDPVQQAQFRELSKEQYLNKFYEVWDLSKINRDKNAIFYILPSLQNAITFDKELQDLKKNPPNKKTKNYQKALQTHNKKITDLEAKVKRLLGVGENLLPNTLEEFSAIIDNMNLNAFLSAPKFAIVTQAGYIRAVPTYKPRYKSKDDFPFDRWQNSFLFEGTPLMITHFSRDGRYAHVRSPFMYGWIDVRNIALVDNSLKNKILKFSDYKVAKSDYIPLYYNNQWVLDARIGQILPFNRSSKRLITFFKDSDNFAQIREIDFDKYQFDDFPVSFSADKMSNIINTMVGQKYGWGGIFGNRDCSSFTRDSFATFGVFLPRNSAAQAKYRNAFMDLSKMKDNEKEEYIIANGVPFGSIIWLKGHIMLYIGYTNVNGTKRAIVAHSIWGTNPMVNKKKERIRLGGVKVTTLHIGAAFDSDVKIENSILSNVKGITNIYADSTGKVDLSKYMVEY